MFMELYLQFGVKDVCPLTNRSGEQEDDTWICFGVESFSILRWILVNEFEIKFNVAVFSKSK